LPIVGVRVVCVCEYVRVSSMYFIRTNPTITKEQWKNTEKRRQHDKKKKKQEEKNRVYIYILRYIYIRNRVERDYLSRVDRVVSR
jgi:hypothetical protein